MPQQKTALLVVDAQTGNFEGPEPIYQAAQLLAKLGSLVEQARASQIPIVYIQHGGGPGAVDEPGTPGWEIHPTIAPRPEDIIVQKRYPDAFQETALQAELKARDIEQVVIAGLQTEYCIDTTCRRAFSLGYQVTLSQDAHSTWDGEGLAAPQIIAHHNRVLGDWFVRLKVSQAIFTSQEAQDSSTKTDHW